MRRSLLLFLFTVIGTASVLDAKSIRFNREVTIPAGTVLRLQLSQPVGSDFSRVEDPVTARLMSPIVVNQRTVLPAGTVAHGSVIDARHSGRVKGRARLGLRFTNIVIPGENDRYTMRTYAWSRQAPATKKQDAVKIGVPAAGGAIIGGIVDGKKGAAIGSLVGGGAGTGVVLATRGKEVRLNRGHVILVRLANPLTVVRS